MPQLCTKIPAIALLAISLSVGRAEAQSGCTDPQALNFDAAASQNDGSCLYPATTYFPPQVAELPANMTEASGLEFYDGQLWVHQDGGVAPQLHHLDTLTGAILQTLPLPSLSNVDWEDLAEDDTYLYIGDFGNNSGTRTDLRIYKINKTDLLAGTATAEAIDFSFSDQTDFSIAFDASKHDCEAMIALGDSLHLFTKSWPDNMTRRYLLPKTPGTHIAELRDSLAAGFLVTAADVSDEGTVLMLGYSGTTSATGLWLLWDYPGTAVFAGNKRKIEIGSALNMSQAEGIGFSTASSGFICSERISLLPQRLFRFDIRHWLEAPSGVGSERVMGDVAAWPNPFSHELNIELPNGLPQGATAELLNMDGRSLWRAALRSGENRVATEGIGRGVYLLRVQAPEGVLQHKLVKK